VVHRASLRASDLDREQIAERLHRATVEGRLLPEELEERLEAAYGARTYGELDRLVADLPVPARPAAPSRPVPLRTAAAGILAFTTLLFAAATVGHSASVAAGSAHHRERVLWIVHHPHPTFAPIAAIVMLATITAAVTWLLTRSRAAPPSWQRH
jgi:hypothetical protein